MSLRRIHYIALIFLKLNVTFSLYFTPFRPVLGFTSGREIKDTW